jgi:hypothetical protein
MEVGLQKSFSRDEPSHWSQVRVPTNKACGPYMPEISVRVLNAVCCADQRCIASTMRVLERIQTIIGRNVSTRIERTHS